jgi:hypothetical protein
MFLYVRLQLCRISLVMALGWSLFELSGAFAKLRKASITFVMSVRPSAYNDLAPIGRIFMKFAI